MPGEMLTRQDAAVDALYFLCSGRASVEVNGSFVTYLEKGSFVGEIAYLTNNLATATVVVDEPSRILAFSKLRMAKVTADDKQRHDLPASPGATVARCAAQHAPGAGDGRIAITQTGNVCGN
jgi:CRP-like cAMP-binding protein